jgi:hypothetical protein
MSDIHDPPDPPIEVQEPLTSASDPTPTNPNPKGQFKKGFTPLVRRRHGSQNKITRDLKNGIIYGASAYGEDGRGKGGLYGYLKMCARKYPTDYMKLLSKLLPYTISADAKALGSVGIGTINIVAAPSDLFLSAEKIRALNGQEPIIEVEPPTVIGTLEEPASNANEVEIAFSNVTRMRRRGKRHDYDK